MYTTPPAKRTYVNTLNVPQTVRGNKEKLVENPGVLEEMSGVRISLWRNDDVARNLFYFVEWHLYCLKWINYLKSGLIMYKLD
ncbi:hypothetical protein [Bacillus sp. THAF10]|uniref:hypothetical protein n=1 Tax=Bacillus sp. THAF10 TaxID=2587848 RepID=UPI001C12A2C8|nr:hypothetical protein [Bacillus sp. THAF10]